METTGATENGHEAAPEGESLASTVTGVAAGAGGGARRFQPETRMAPRATR